MGRPIKSDLTQGGDQAYTESLVLGPFDRDRVDEEVEYVRRLDEENHNLPILREVMRKGHGMYERSKGKASQASYKRTKEMIKEGKGIVGSASGVHPVFFRSKDPKQADAAVKKLKEEEKRKALLQAVNSFKPAETVLEIGARGNTETASLMKQRRKALGKAIERAAHAATSSRPIVEEEEEHEEEKADKDEEDGSDEDEGMEMADEETIAVCSFSHSLNSLFSQLISCHRPFSIRRAANKADMVDEATRTQSITCHIIRKVLSTKKGTFHLSIIIPVRTIINTNSRSGILFVMEPLSQNKLRT